MKIEIETEEDNEMLLAAVEALMMKGEANNSPAELAFLRWIAPIIEAWEENFYGAPKRNPNATQ